jgi:hypothetical protein
MTFENKRLEVIGNISEELTPSIFRVCAQLKGPPPPTGLPCPYTSLFVTYHLLLFIQNSDKRFLYNTGTHTTRQHIPEGNVLHFAVSLNVPLKILYADKSIHSYT